MGCHTKYLVHVLHWPDDGCFTAETCSPDVIDISSLLMYICCVLDCNIHIEIRSLLPTVTHWNMSAELIANAGGYIFPIIPRAEEQIRNSGTKQLTF